MKKNTLLYAIAIAALLTTPAVVRAQDAASTNAPAATAPAKKHGMQFKGKIVAIDATAMTLTVGTKTFNITSTTKITKDGKPATLADFAVGDPVSGNYKKNGDKLDATALHDHKKKAE